MRPCVPGESTEASRSQKSGDFSKYTSSLDMVRRRPLLGPPVLPPALFPVRGLKTPLFLFWELTKMADKNFSLSREPTSRNSGDTCQQVLNWQLPDVPWHLHFLFMLSVTICVKKSQLCYKSEMQQCHLWLYTPVRVWKWDCSLSNKTLWIIPHLSSHTVVVYPHASVDVSWRAAGVQPVPGKTVPKTDVMAATPPLPRLLHGAQLIWYGLEQGRRMGGAQVSGQVAMVTVELWG